MRALIARRDLVRSNTPSNIEGNQAQLAKHSDEIWGALFVNALHTHAMEMADPPDDPGPPPLGPGVGGLVLQLGLYAAQTAQRNKMDQANDWFARALERNPNRAETLYYAAKLELEVHGNKEAALLHLKRCRRVNAHYRECALMLKSIGQQLGDAKTIDQTGATPHGYVVSMTLGVLLVLALMVVDRHAFTPGAITHKTKVKEGECGAAATVAADPPASPAKTGDKKKKKKKGKA